MPTGETGETGETLPTGWGEMTSVTLPILDYTVTVTEGELSGTFTFRIRKQPASTRTIATLASTFERFVLTFGVSDITDYDATGNPLTVFGTALTTMLIRALRSLIMGGTTMIPVPDAQVTFGSANMSYVDTVEIAQTSDRTVDDFLVTCNIKEASVTNTNVSSEPQVNKSDDLPPWQMPAELTFESQTTEGLTLGFAYPVDDLDGKKTYNDTKLRVAGLATSADMVAVENYANDPFSSPPAFPKVNGTLRVSKSFLRGGGTVNLSALHGTVNGEAISINVEGAVIDFPIGTLSPTMMQITPKMYKMPVPWLPKTKHPLSKTYGELFYGYSTTTANRIAVNKTNEIIVVYKPVRYIEVSAAFSFRPEGFAVWLANRGYTELDSSAAEGRTTITDGKGTTKEAWLDKSGTRSSEERIWRGFTMVKTSAEVVTLLRAFYPVNNTFAWATAKDNFGSAVVS